MEIAQVSTVAPAGEVLTVTEIVARVKKIILESQSIKSVSIRGEISGFKMFNSNAYFNLKDERAVLKCVIWPHVMAKTECKDLKDGDKVVLGGYISFYDGRSEVQLHVEGCQLEGVGKLYKQYVELKAKLSEEGLFAQERKKPIPSFPSKVGIITSLTGEGKAKNDFLRILMMGPAFEIILMDSRVQGDVAKDLCQALTKLDGAVDLILIGRGGGSIEDLWVFNDEELARTIARCRTPVISAVGHETDEVITDFVADCRAQTPTDAANIVIDKMNHVVRDFQTTETRMHNAIQNTLMHRHQMMRTINVHQQRRIISSSLEFSKQDLTHTNAAFQDVMYKRIRESRRMANGLSLGVKQSMKNKIETNRRELCSVDVRRQKRILDSTLSFSQHDLTRTDAAFHGAIKRKIVKSREEAHSFSKEVKESMRYKLEKNSIALNIIDIHLDLKGNELKRMEVQRARQHSNLRKAMAAFLLFGFITLLSAIVLNIETMLKLLIALIGLVSIGIGVIGLLNYSKKSKVVKKDKGVVKMATFEKTVDRLKEIVKELEKDKLPLEKALELYEEGVVLSKDANEFLAKAEHKITELDTVGSK